MRGVYVLVIQLDRPAEVEVGKLGMLRFAPGTYAYVGSAMRGIEARVRRHLRKEKRLRWHIDYLLASPAARVAEVYVRETPERLECEVADALAAECQVVPGFGSSDCRCKGHLFRCDPPRLFTLLSRLGFARLTLSGHREWANVVSKNSGVSQTRR